MLFNLLQKYFDEYSIFVIIFDNKSHAPLPQTVYAIGKQHIFPVTNLLRPLCPSTPVRLHSTHSPPCGSPAARKMAELSCAPNMFFIRGICFIARVHPDIECRMLCKLNNSVRTRAPDEVNEGRRHRNQTHTHTHTACACRLVTICMECARSRATACL